MTQLGHMQNIEDLRMQYAVGHLTNYGKKSSVLISNSQHLSPMITSPIRLTPWIPTFKKKPAKGESLTYVGISQNNGHLPMEFRLTAHPPCHNVKTHRLQQLHVLISWAI
jgi:hypothetical protein